MQKLVLSTGPRTYEQVSTLTIFIEGFVHLCLHHRHAGHLLQDLKAQYRRHHAGSEHSTGSLRVLTYIPRHKAAAGSPIG